jgi:hypothetical protein
MHVIKHFCSFLLSGMFFIGMPLGILTLNAQSFEVYKFQIENSDKKIGQFKNSEGQVPMVIENVGKKITYVFNDADIVFMVDTMLDAFFNFYYPDRKEPYAIPLKQFLIGNNKVQFYGYHVPTQILYDLNNDSYTKIYFQPTDTLIRWKNKKEATFFSGQCEIKDVQKSYLFIPYFSLGFKQVFPKIVKSPKHRIEWVATYVLKELLFKEQMEEIRKKLTNFSTSHDKIKSFDFKNYFIPDIKESIPFIQKHPR